MHHCTQLLVEIGSCELFVWAVPQTTTLSISASQVARIIGMVLNLLWVFLYLS
jgi:hypothetical protein